MAGHAQIKFLMTECSKTQIRLTGLIWLPAITIGTPEIIAVIILKFDHGDFGIQQMHPKDVEGMANNVDPDQRENKGWENDGW